MTRTSTYRYNKKPYFWYLDGYLYIPNVDWDAMKLEAIFEGNNSDFLCNSSDQCKIRQDLDLPFPEYLFSEIEQYVVKELTFTIQVPTNGADDSQNVLR
jgi:hypothetical protein